jgi:hypothetical protein
MSSSSSKSNRIDAARAPEKVPVMESGVLPKGLSAQLDRPPPWDMVQDYLTTGKHRGWIEGWARRDAAFAEVLAALRNDALERQEDDAKVTPIRRR